jgi:integrase
MAAKMVRTRTPGIYKRGSRYVVTYKVNGRQKKESARTLDQARSLKSVRQADIERGEFHEQTHVKFRKYAEEWIERYQGRGRRGFRESTREDYQRDLKRYAYPFFDERLRRTVSQITPRDVANFLGWLCDEQAQRQRWLGEAQDHARRMRAQGKMVKEPVAPARVVLADATVRRILSPVRACLADARREGLIRHNPTADASLPHRARESEEKQKARVFTREQLAMVLELIHPHHRLMFRVLASTGIRISEALGLQWSDLELDGGAPHLKVRRALVRGRYGPPKSRYGRRDLPLEHSLVCDLRQHRSKIEWSKDDDPVFASRNGKPLRRENLRRRVLRPAAEEADVAWAGFHTFRHTFASILFERGTNVVKVQRWLGHHSPAFTMATYVHLLNDRLDQPLELGTELPKVATLVATEATPIDRNGDVAAAAESAEFHAAGAEVPSPLHST